MRSQCCFRSRPGFTITEVLVAAIILAVGLLGFGSALESSIRSVAESRRGILATADAELRRERAAAACITDAGTDTVSGASVTWTSSAVSGSVSSVQQTVFGARMGAHTDSYDSAALCR